MNAFQATPDWEFTLPRIKRMLRLGVDIANVALTPGQLADAAIYWETNSLTDADIKRMQGRGVNILCPYEVARHLAATVTWKPEELYPPGYFLGFPDYTGKRDPIGASPAPLLADWSCEWAPFEMDDLT